MPAWAISQIEELIYVFFWNYKRHLVNKDILALLPLKEGGFNIPRLKTKMQALRLNTLRRFLREEQAHWKHFTTHFLRISILYYGKMSLALDYSLQHINRDIPSFHKELLTAWYRHKDHHTRIRFPESVTDILNESLFLNPVITTEGKPLIFADWIAAGITRMRDICYEVVPGYLPMSAIHEILTDQGETPLGVSRTTLEWGKLLDAIPMQWSQQIVTASARPPPTLQPCFAIVNSSSEETPTDISSCRTRHFYGHLLQADKPVIPAVDYWKQTCQPKPRFNTKQWKTLYPPLINNKHGDVNWKIAHRVLPTALSLNRIGVSPTPNCHRCGATDNLEHAMLKCPTVDNLWSQIQAYVDKMTDQKLTLNTQVKLFGKMKTKKDPLGPRLIDLINWTLTLARWAIYKFAVNYCLQKDLTFSPEAFLKFSLDLIYVLNTSCISQNTHSIIFPFTGT